MALQALRTFGLSVLTVLASFTSLEAAVPNRIGAISGSSRIALTHTVSRKAQMASDLGQAPLDKVLSSVTLHFNMSAAQQSALTQLLIDQQNPSSPRFHQWLTPAQFGAQFGMSSSDLAKVSSWLIGQGLSVTAVAPSSNSITVSGTVTQVQTALGVSLHSLSLDGELRISNVTDPLLPAAVANVTQGITGLNDFRLKPRAKTRVIHPNFTSSLTGDHFVAPGDYYTIYDIAPLLASSINGSGITIAVMGQTDISLSDVAAFRSAAGLAANAPSVRLATTDPGTNTDDLMEAQLDVEWSGATAPNASILYVNSNYSSGGAFNSLIYAINGSISPAPPILSISYGDCESDLGQSTLTMFNQYFQQANAQGQTIVGPAGDAGATDCDYNSTVAADGLAVDFPASSPFVTGVGGTMLNEGTGSYWSTTNNGNGGSALSYIPEAVWDETNSTNGIAAGGGGVSAFFAKPVWQTGAGVPSDLSRDVPDISLDAAYLHDGYLYCVSGSCVTGFRGSDGQSLTTVGGTSASTPAFAGILALVEQKIGTRIGNANPQIYGLANSTYYNNVFHDVTTGSNSTPCLQGSPNCPSGGNIGYSTAVGYDLASGWGSVDAYNLATKWGLVPSAGSGSTVGAAITTTVVTTSSAPCGISGGTLALNVAVSSTLTNNTAVPTGSVQFLIDNVANGSPVALTNGSAGYSLNTAALSSGGHTVSAIYLGDGTFAGSKGSLLTDVVSTTLPDFSITPCTTSVSVASGSTAAGITFTATPFNGFTGNVTFSAISDASLAASYTFSVTPVVISGTSGSSTVLTLSAFQTDSKSSTGQAKTSAGKIASSGSAGRHSIYAAGSGAMLASLVLLMVPRRRRWGALLAVVFSVAAIGSSGCGGGASTVNAGTVTPTPTTTPALSGDYNVTVVGTGTNASGTLVHSAQIRFHVQ